MKTSEIICAAMIVMLAAPAWSQVEGDPVQPAAAFTETSDQPVQNQTAGANSDQMQTPPVVSGQAYSTTPTSEQRSNYLRGGVGFISSYSNNAAETANGQPISQLSYSITPMVALDKTTSRLHFNFSYAPGFTFYQHTSDLNSSNENAAIAFSYRLSPHVTLSAHDGLMKTSSLLSQPDFVPGGPVTGGTEAANLSVISPVADLLTNSGSVGLTYQFSANQMIGANGTFSNLHYPNLAQVTGLYDSSSQGGSVFYSYRVTRMHYFGVTYQYQRLVAQPTAGVDETQTHAILGFYTLYPTTRLSISLFGGPQYSDTIEPPIAPLPVAMPAARAWTPAVGGSLSWQGRLNAFAMSYSHIISGGGGLSGAVHMDSASALWRQTIAKNLNATVSGAYVQNNLIGGFTLPGSSNGHTVSETVTLQRQFHQFVNMQVGYTRLHQDYSGVPVLSALPDTNREFISLSYQFSKAVGR
jgi:hypothetical protein